MPGIDLYGPEYMILSLKKKEKRTSIDPLITISKNRMAFLIALNCLFNTRTLISTTSKNPTREPSRIQP